MKIQTLALLAAVTPGVLGLAASGPASAAPVDDPLETRACSTSIVTVDKGTVTASRHTPDKALSFSATPFPRKDFGALYKYVHARAVGGTTSDGDAEGASTAIDVIGAGADGTIWRTTAGVQLKDGKVTHKAAGDLRKITRVAGLKLITGAVGDDITGPARLFVLDNKGKITEVTTSAERKVSTRTFTGSYGDLTTVFTNAQGNRLYGVTAKGELHRISIPRASGRGEARTKIGNGGWHQMSHPVSVGCRQDDEKEHTFMARDKAGVMQVYLDQTDGTLRKLGASTLKVSGTIL